MHPGDLARGCFDLEITWLLCCAGTTIAFTLTDNIKRSGQPSCLHELLQDYQPTYSLRSASHDLLATTRPRLLHLVPLDILQLPPGTLYI